MQFKFGCDPEVFLHSPYEGYVSAHGLLPGTKKEPFKVDRGAVQVDGLAFEFNIDPVDNEEDFNKNIEIVLAQMREMVHKVSDELSIVFTPFARFDPDYFNLVDEDAKILGCDPDFDIEGNMRTPDPELGFRPFRTAAGHVHIGWLDPQEGIDIHSDPHIQDCIAVSKLFRNKKMFFPVTNEEQERVKYYGGNGAFRPKPYGVELRTPSNRWVEKKEDRKYMFRLLKYGMEQLGQR